MMTNYFKKLAGSVLLATTLGAGSVSAQLITQTLSYSGSIQTFTVPSCVAQMTIETRGAQGGSGFTGTGGLGARMIGVFTVTPGQVISYLVGKCPGVVPAQFNYPAGGGGSYVAAGASYSNATPLIVAGGGGGGNNGVSGDNGVVTTSGTGLNPGTNGNGAPASSCGGGGGGFYTSGGTDTQYSYTGGQGFQQGGAGGVPNASFGGASYQSGGFGGGAPADYYSACNLRGGAGGGYSGGSGYGTSLYDVGSGGGSFNSGTSQLNTAGFQTGDGLIILSYYTILPITSSASPSAICNGSTLTLNASGLSSYTWAPVGSFSGSNQPTVTVSPSVATTYSLTGTTANGCPAAARVTVTVSPGVPSLTIASSSPSVCSGNTLALTASGALTYTWVNSGVTNAVTFTPNATAVYTVTGSNGCGNSTGTVSIPVVPLPVTASASSTLICASTSATLTASGATSYTWSPGTSTVTNYMVTPSANTTYTLFGRTGNCSNTTFITLLTKLNPTLTIVASNGTVLCSGDTKNLSVTGNAVTYTWSVGGQTAQSIVVSPTNTAIYSVTGTNTVGCTTTTSQVIYVSQNPTISVAASADEVCVLAPVTLTASGAATYTWTDNNATTSSTVFNPSITSTYSVVGSYTNGCNTTTVITISVFDPSVSVSSNTSVCIGSAVMLMASDADTYAWSTGATGANISVSPTIATTYTVTGNTADPINGLVCPSTNTISVAINDLPVITATSNHTAICIGTTASLTAAGAGAAGTYTWAGGLGNSTIIAVSPIANQSYTVSGKDTNGCKGSGRITINVAMCTGINAIVANSSNMVIYPNPSNGEFTVSSDQVITLTITNELGQQVRTITLGSATPEVKVNNLSNGVYFIMGTNENGSVRQKIVIAK